MKKLAIALSLSLLAGWAGAQTAERTTTGDPQAVKPKAHVVKGEFVSADLEKKSATIKLQSGESTTVPLDGKALTDVKELKAGQKVIVICKDDADGKHLAAISIKAVPNTKPAKP